MKAVRDTSILFGRSMRHIMRSPDTIITVAIIPIMIMLMFVYVLGGAIQTGTDNYVDYLLPGIILMAIASGIAYTAVRLFTDVQKGLFQRFHSMPISRSSVLWGHVLTSLVSNAISIVLIILVALLIGFRSSAGIVEWLAVAGILLLFTLALTWVAVIPVNCQISRWSKRIFLSAHIFTIHQFCFCSDRYDANCSTCFCRKSTSDLYC